MIIWETEGLLLSRDRVIETSNVTQTLEPTLKGNRKASEGRGLERVSIWGETGSLLLNPDRFAKTSNVA